MRILIFPKLVNKHPTCNIGRTPFQQFIRHGASLERKKNPEEFSEVPLYPPIEDCSLEYKWKKKVIDWHKKIAQLPTVEQKLVELNMPKYYGYHSVLLNEEILRPYSHEFVKFATRTQIIPSLPTHYYDYSNNNVDKIVDAVKPQVKDLISAHFGNTIRYCAKKQKAQEKLRHDSFIVNMNNLMLQNVIEEIKQFSEIPVDLHPRIESFWFLGGFEPPNVVKKMREGRKNELNKKMANHPSDKPIRCSISPTLALRMNHGLPEVVPMDAQIGDVVKSSESINEGEASSLDVELSNTETTPFAPFETDPKYWGLTSRRKRATIVPGFWPGEKHEHNLLFFHSRENEMELIEKYGDSDELILPSMMQQKLMVAGFSQALSYSLYQGFTPVNELTYPFVQQSICTNGQKWQFAIYQMNTCSLHSSFSVDNPRTNFLWMSDDLKLFEGVEGSSVKGFNEDVLRILCSMYLKKGVPRVNSHPYLADYKYLMHHDAPDEYKDEFQKTLHFLLSERPRRHPRPEILPWEFIYKVLFKTRIRDRRSKFFENRYAENPYTKRLDDYRLPYIPKVRRLFHKIKFKPRLNSEHLFKHDWKTLKLYPFFDDDEIAFKTMNINKETPPYYNGLKWSRGMTTQKPKI